MAKKIAQKHWKWIAGTLLILALMSFFTTRLVDAWSRRPTEDRLALGRQIFEHVWQENDPLAGEGDGLGPVFNEKSCVACHFQGGVGGGGSNRFNVLAYEVLPVKERPDPFGGVIHAFATRPEFLESKEIINRRFPPIDGGVRIVNGCQQEVPSFNPLDYESINTPALFGAGLIDEMSTLSVHLSGTGRSLKKMSKELEGDFSGITVGRTRMVSGGRMGRFGWKGQFATLEEFVATACAVELGLSNPMRAQDIPQQNLPDPQAKLDINSKQLRALVCFVANLPRPVEILPDNLELRNAAIRGKQLFTEIGCADCHAPDMGGVEGVYSDFRLYEVDGKQADPSYTELPSAVILADGQPRPSEWKTPPLWGVADSAPYFHDGQSATLTDAIMRHDLQAREARQLFENLADENRAALLEFLQTLRAPRVDADATIALAEQP